ncbi:transcriptional regulator opi1 [Lithohypha guttulata]|nr:transcriptional regulator opi1 [Lithohypha guttulata]
MEAQHAVPPYPPPPPPPFSPDNVDRRSFGRAKVDVMDVESRDARTQRAASVLSGLSADDLEAAETLKSLQQDVHSPRLHQPPPNHVQTRSSFNGNEPEPLLSLITSQYPLAASVINGSISVYKTAQQYTPGGEWTERNVGLPLARTTARISGVESVARWALQPKRDPRNGPQATPDIEKAVLEISSDGVVRQADLARGEQLPAYSAGDRSPPYSEHLVLSREHHPGVGWRQQLIITTSGLGVAMSEESIRSLKYCLGWLRWANGRLGGAVASLKDLLQQWEHRPSHMAQPMSVSNLTIDDSEDHALHARIAAVKADVLATLKQVVQVVSTYAGGALPENARRLVHQHLVSLPQRFTIASRSSDEENHDAATNNANRAIVLAQEGLDMMNQVTRVVNDTLVSAEDWIEKLGRGRRQVQPHENAEKSATQEPARERSETVGHDSDVKMEM